VRIASLLVPDLPLRAELRARPESTERALVVASGTEARDEVIAVSGSAARAGVQPGCTVAHARAVSGELVVRVASPALERAARQSLLDVALAFSPRATVLARPSGAFASEACVLLDASGVERLFQSERGFASALAARATSLGLPGVVAIASSGSIAQLLARRAARRSEGLFVLPPGSEARVLAPLPIDLLDPEDGLAQTLTRFGIRRVGDLLRLPQSALAHRLGPEVFDLLARVRGEQGELPLVRPVEARIEEGIDLECPIDRLEPLLFVLRGMISRLTERLGLRALGCGPLDLELTTSDGRHDARRVGVSAPTRDVRVLLRLTSLALESQPPEAPIESLSLATQGRELRADQLDLFRPRGPDPAELGRTLAELESLCGAERVGTPEVADDHRPNVFGIKPFAGDRVEDPALSAPGPPAAHGALAVRALRPPVQARVRVERGRPDWIESAVATGSVVHASGPWRSTGRWWDEQGRFAVDHFDIQVSDGTLFRLCFDWIAREWRVDAVYD